MRERLQYLLPILIMVLFFSAFAHSVRVYSREMGRTEMDKIKVFIDNADVINDRGEQMVLITVINNSHKTFNGRIKLSSIGVKNEYLTFDVFHLSIFPGKTEARTVWLKKSLIPHIKTEIIDPQFNSFEPKISTKHFLTPHAGGFYMPDNLTYFVI